jgi:hypothetical protein
MAFVRPVKKEPSQDGLSMPCPLTTKWDRLSRSRCCLRLRSSCRTALRCCHHGDWLTAPGRPTAAPAAMSMIHSGRSLFWLLTIWAAAPIATPSAPITAMTKPRRGPPPWVSRRHRRFLSETKNGPPLASPCARDCSQCPTTDCQWDISDERRTGAAVRQALSRYRPAGRLMIVECLCQPLRPAKLRQSCDLTARTSASEPHNHL